jgi:hypothetical protein
MTRSAAGHLLIPPAAQLVGEIAAIVASVTATRSRHAEAVGAGKKPRRLTTAAVAVVGLFAVAFIIVIVVAVATMLLLAIVAIRWLVAIVPAIVVPVAVEVVERALVAVGAAELVARADRAAAEPRILVSCSAPMLSCDIIIAVVVMVIVIIVIVVLTVVVSVTHPGLWRTFHPIRKFFFNI